MQKWEYLRVIIDYSLGGKVLKVWGNGENIFDNYDENGNEKKGQALFGVSEYFQIVGREGWELVAALTWNNGRSETYCFKRPIE